MPSVSKEPSFLKVFEELNVAFRSVSDSEAIAEACPFCEKDRFYLNVKTGLYDCKHCHAGGNVTTFLTWVHQKHLADTTAEHYLRLKKKRGIASQTLKAHELAYDSVENRWLIPFKNAKGNVVNIQMYYPDRKTKPNKFNLTGLPTSIYGFDKLARAPKDKIVFICEGPFDAIALDYKIGFANRAKYVIVAIPGTFKADWAEHFRGFKVRALYDNDAGGKAHAERAQKLLGTSGVAAEVQVLRWPPDFPDGYDLNDFVRDPRHAAIAIVGWLKVHSFKVVPAPKLDIELGWERDPDEEEEAIDWPWPHHLRCGTYVSFSGTRGVMKSTIAADIVARYTKGLPMPMSDQVGMPAGHVIYITAEDSRPSVWAKLKTAEADEKRVIMMSATLKDGDPLNILEHLPELTQLIRQYAVRLVVIDGQNSVVGAPNISTDMLARNNITNKLHQFAQKENICLIGIRNEDKEGRPLGPQSMADLARCILRAIELQKSGGERYFQLVFERISDAAPKTHPPIPYAVEDLGGSSRRILWGKERPKPSTLEDWMNEPLPSGVIT